MKLDGSTLAIEPRSIGECLDLAILFYRSHARELLVCTLIFGGPAGALSYRLALSTEAGLEWAFLVFFFFSPFLGAVVVAGAGPHAFGETFTIGGALKRWGRHLGILASLLMPARFILGLSLLVCLGFPFLYLPLATRFAFIAEVLLLEKQSWRRTDRRLDEITRHFRTEIAFRYVVIVCFAAALSLSLFAMLDLSSGALFGFPILLGKLSSRFFFEEFFYLLFRDPLVIVALSSTWWLVYPVARLAFFLCYLDTRIRREGWDVELAFRIEANRLQEVTGS